MEKCCSRPSCSEGGKIPVPVTCRGKLELIIYTLQMESTSHHFLDPNLSFATVFGISELDGEGQKTQPKNSERQNSLLLVYSSVCCKPQKLSAVFVVQTNGILFKPHGRHQHAECPDSYPTLNFLLPKAYILCYIILSICLPEWLWDETPQNTAKAVPRWDAAGFSVASNWQLKEWEKGQNEN